MLIRQKSRSQGKPGYVYHAFRNPGGGGCNGYFGDPSGWQYIRIPAVNSLSKSLLLILK